MASALLRNEMAALLHDRKLSGIGVESGGEMSRKGKILMWEAVDAAGQQQESREVRERVGGLWMSWDGDGDMQLASGREEDCDK